MIKFTQLGMLVALVFALTSKVQAAVLIEPVLGYNLASKADIEDGENYSGGRGVAYGGRLGYQNLGFQLGIDYLNSTIDMDDSDFDKDLKTSEWAGFVGFEFPILFRVYAGYIFAGSGDTEYEGMSVDLKSGNGPKIGIGWTLLPFIDINFEYRQVNYDMEIGSAETELKTNSYMISLSLPFTI